MFSLPESSLNILFANFRSCWCSPIPSFKISLELVNRQMLHKHTAVNSYKASICICRNSLSGSLVKHGKSQMSLHMCCKIWKSFGSVTEMQPVCHAALCPLQSFCYTCSSPAATNLEPFREVQHKSILLTPSTLTCSESAIAVLPAWLSTGDGQEGKHTIFYPYRASNSSKPPEARELESGASKLR